MQNFVHGQLSQRFPGGKTALQLDLEPHHGHGVADVGFPDVGKLGVVLHALHQQQRVGAVLHGEGGVLFQHLIHRIVHGGGFGQHGLRLGLGGEEAQHIVVFGDLDAVLLQLSRSLCAQTLGVDKEDSAVLRDIAVGHGIRGALDVHGAQVQQPCQIVQLAHQLCGAPQLLELCAELAQLLGGGEPCVLLAQDPSGSLRQGGAALGPELIFQIQGLDGAVLGVQRLLDAAHQMAGSGQTAQAQHPAFGQSIGAVLLHGGHTRLTHPLQLDLGARDFLFRLHEIAAGGPRSW